MKKIKLKHNKKRNTAFLFEALVREVTKAAVDGDKQRQKELLKLVKEHFNKTSILNSELKLYKNIVETKGVSKRYAERLLEHVQAKHNFLNKEMIFEEQTALIKKVNESFGKDTYSNFVPNYKCLATTYQVLNGDLEIKHQIMMENEIINYMCSKKDSDVMKVDKLVYKTYLENFNKEFDQKLIPAQKKLLEEYVSSFNDNGLMFKIYLSEETSRLKKTIQEHSKKNKELKSVLGVFDMISKSKFNDKIFEKLLYIQELVSKIENEN